jgi:hypothetical protein
MESQPYQPEPAHPAVLGEHVGDLRLARHQVHITPARAPDRDQRPLSSGEDAERVSGVPQFLGAGDHEAP